MNESPGGFQTRGVTEPAGETSPPVGWRDFHILHPEACGGLLEPDDQRLAEPTVTTFLARVEKVARLPSQTLRVFRSAKNVAMDFFPFCEANKGGALSPLRKNVRLTRSVYRALLRRARMALRNEPNRGKKAKQKRSPFGLRFRFGSPCWARTNDIMINSHALYRLS